MNENPADILERVLRLAFPETSLNLELGLTQMKNYYKEMIMTEDSTQSALDGGIIPVLNHGHVRVVDKMGDDSSIVQMARVSYGKGTKTVNEDRGLIRYLVRHRHTTPLEGCVIKLHLKMPVFVARQWVRHRTASLNEYSARYSEVPDQFYVPDLEEIKLQSQTNKQGSEGEVDHDDRLKFLVSTKMTSEKTYNEYKDMLDRGVSREMARINLPLTMYTEFYWQMNLHNLFHFCSLRSDPHAQEQIRVYSDIILHKIIKEWCPLAYEAFMDYTMNSVTFSDQEHEIIRNLISGRSLADMQPLINQLSKREQDEFLKKIK